jgi:protease IV
MAIMMTAWFMLLAGGLLLLVVLAVALAPQSSGLPDRGVLVIDLDDVWTEGTRPSSSEEVIERLLANDFRQRLTLWQILEALDAAQDDPRVAGVLLRGRGFAAESTAAHYPGVAEVRDALATLSRSGKPVFAHVNNDSQRSWYLKSVADHVWIQPLSVFFFNGIAAERLFFGEALERLGVRIEVARVGAYKSMPDEFVRRAYSDADREQMQVLVDQLWDTLLRDVAQSRGNDLERLRQSAAKWSAWDAEQAVALGLVDGLGYADEVETQVAERLQLAAGPDFPAFSLGDYIRHTQAQVPPTGHRGRIGLLTLEGPIVDGHGGSGQAGAEAIAEELRSLRDDPEIDAVVLRVHSPGGSASGSETIAREVTLTAQRKPVVVSMAGVAASGGYWVAAPATRIVADASSITGSIGVLRILIGVDALAARWGVHADRVRSATQADYYSVFRTRSDEELAREQVEVETVYHAFIDRVATGRQLSQEAVDAVAQGRVWTGSDAQRHGLVDRLGGLRLAVATAADLADIGDDYQVIDQQPAGRWQQVLDALQVRIGSLVAARYRANHSLLGRVQAVIDAELRSLQAMNDPRGVYAFLPWLWQVE